jgi:hypothetical protein
MKGISFKVIVDIIIAIFAIIVFVFILKSIVPGFYGQSLCRIYEVVQSIPLPDFLKPSISECSTVYKTEKVTIEESDAGVIADRLLEKYILTCWKEKAGCTRETGTNPFPCKVGVTFSCYDITIRSIVGSITEQQINNMMKSRGYCDTLPNNVLDYEKTNDNCGDLNKIYWSVEGGAINGTYALVVVKYDAFHHRIEVV